MASAMDERKVLETDAHQKTLDIRDTRTLLEAELTAEAGYVDGIAKGNEAVITSAGMDTTAPAGGRIGAMPKVEGLSGTQGDEPGEVDLHWNAIKRGLKNYTIEKTEDPAGLTGWVMAKVSSTSKASVTGLVSGKRYFFRVSANGSAGPGPASDPTSKVAP